MPDGEILDSFGDLVTVPNAFQLKRYEVGETIYEDGSLAMSLFFYTGEPESRMVFAIPLEEMGLLIGHMITVHRMLTGMDDE